MTLQALVFGCALRHPIQTRVLYHHGRRERALWEACRCLRQRTRNHGSWRRKEGLQTNETHHKNKKTGPRTAGRAGLYCNEMKLQHIGEAEFSWARIVSIETESDTCKCRREGILRCSEQIGGQSKTCKGTFKEAAQKLALNRG